ncbi:hypothetical protein [Streptomyces sp. NPDC020965]|uniref:hypothetical protein n=1 Tax=Streptomyces sp. NPDC020965 TaxID=3365105 RepID=UPI0037B748DD
MEYPLAVVMETMPPTLIESLVTPRTEEESFPPASPEVDAELQAVLSSSAEVTAAMARVRMGRGTVDPSVGGVRILCRT